MSYLQKLCAKKAEENNTICLNAYAIGIEDSKAEKMLEMLHLLIDGDCIRYESVENDIKQLIKEVTEL